MAKGILSSDLPVGKQALLGLCILLVIILGTMALSWNATPAAPGFAGANTAGIHVRILAVNDFHGQLPAGKSLNKEPVGGIPVLASYLRAAITEGTPAATFIALPGDVVGASPPESGLLLDEPSILFFNGFGNDCCSQGTPGCSASCNMVATFGNHEFDKGTTELMRKINGGDGTTNITHIRDPYPGTRASYVCSNVAWKENRTLIVPPYVIRNAGGVKIAFIGADTANTVSLEMPGNIHDVAFLNETESINRYIPEIQKQGVHAIVVLLHEGGSQDAYTGPTRPGGNVSGRVKDIVAGLDPDVDLVLSGHTHMFTNAYLENAGGKPVLVTQAYSYGQAFADVDLIIDPVTGEITEKSAQIVPDFADRAPGTTPDLRATAFLAEDEQIVSPLTGSVIAVAATDITRLQTPSGECALGDLVADAQRDAVDADIGFITTGSLRADIVKGNVTWGNLYSVQPFSGTIETMTLSGRQVRAGLERQWQTPLPPHNLGVSGISYTYNESMPAGNKIVEIRVGEVPLEDIKEYRVSMVDYLAAGGDGYTTFTKGTDVVSGPIDIDALVAYMGILPQPVKMDGEPRIIRIS